MTVKKGRVLTRGQFGRPGVSNGDGYVLSRVCVDEEISSVNVYVLACLCSGAQIFLTRLSKPHPLRAR